MLLNKTVHTCSKKVIRYKCHCGCLLLSHLQAWPTLSTTVFQTDSNLCFAFQHCGNWRKKMVFNSLTSWTGSPGYTRSPSTVHRTRILSPNIASLAILTPSVAILDSHCSLGYFESTLATEIKLWSTFAISEESRIFVLVFLNGSGSGSESLLCGVEWSTDVVCCESDDGVTHTHTHIHTHRHTHTHTHNDLDQV